MIVENQSFLSSDLDDFDDTTEEKSDPIDNIIGREMDLCGIPNFLQEQYLNGNPPPVISSLRPWQRELFTRTEWMEGNNCLILVPTAAGKTVAAEVAIAQLLQKNPHAKVIYCLPFVSLAAEKFSELTARFPGFSVRPFYGNIGGSEFRHGSIAVATFEKAHSLVNMAIRHDYVNDIGLVIIDEIHMIGETHRGATVEAFVVKLRMLENQPRIIGLSATIGSDDAEVFGRWMDGFVFKRDERPCDLKQYIKFIDGSLGCIENGTIGAREKKLTSVFEDKTHLVPIVANEIQRDQNNSVLIFVNSRNETRRIAKLIATFLYSMDFLGCDFVSRELIQARKELLNQIAQVRNVSDEVMNFCLLKGIAFHHAGLLLEERKLIEKGLRKGVLNVIVATTTLSAGINISNVSLVIIQGLFRKELNGGSVSISAAQYKQMAGRAGRVANSGGSVVIIQQFGTDEETRVILELSQMGIGRLQSHLLEDEDFDRYYLQCLYCMKGEAFTQLAVMSFKAFSEYINENDLRDIRTRSEERLKNDRLIINDRRITKLGEAIAGSNMSIQDGLDIYDSLIQLQQDCCLSDELHLIYLCVPSDLGFRTPSYGEAIWEKIFYKHEHVFNLVIGMNSDQFNQLVAKVFISGHAKEGKRRDYQMDRLFAGCVLLDVIDEQPMGLIERKYGLDRGSIQGLQTNAATFAGQVVKLCEICGFGVLGAALNRFSKRLDSAVKNELLDLMSLPACTREVARLLFNQGIEKPEDLLDYTVDELAPLLGGNDSIPIAERLLQDLNLMENLRQKAEILEEEMQLRQVM